MAHLLDTSIVIHVRDKNSRVLAHMLNHRGSVAMSSLTAAELERGVYKKKSLTADRLPRLQAIFDEIPVLPFDLDAARAYGQIIAQRGWVKGRDFDRMIAAHALSTGSVLVTNNEADFSDVP
ncbi:MAG: type II toxin-antitoxin system VapC family toxin, partial [Alphaproteobacteria bacterium]|nr:type II toxin-antitoxin system VapC family toxin [Alphaproteobacteria bacterium]